MRAYFNIIMARQTICHGILADSRSTNSLTLFFPFQSSPFAFDLCGGKSDNFMRCISQQPWLYPAAVGRRLQYVCSCFKSGACVVGLSCPAAPAGVGHWRFMVVNQAMSSIETRPTH